MRKRGQIQPRTITPEAACPAAAISHSEKDAWRSQTRRTWASICMPGKPISPETGVRCAAPVFEMTRTLTMVASAEETMATPDTEPTAATPGPDDLEAVERLSRAYQKLTQEVGKAIVGQTRVLDELLIAMFARGHCLLIGVPGLAKTLMIRTLADALNLSFSRVQFTPDLMPSDITGTEVIQEDRTTGQREFKFLRGPLFANVVLADEINRTPPKTQAALLEAMQEHQVTASGTTPSLARAFLRTGHAKPDRAGGHVSASGGAAGSVHVQCLRGLSRRKKRNSGS